MHVYSKNKKTTNKQQTQFLNPHDTFDKRPKLERARSAAEKENLPLQHSGSQLRRQYSQQETSTTRRMSASDSGVDDHYGQRSNFQHTHHQTQQQLGSNSSTVGSGGQQMYNYNQSPHYRSNSSSYLYQSQGGYPDEDPHYYQVSYTDAPRKIFPKTNEISFEFPEKTQGEIEGLMRQHPHLVHPRQQGYLSGQSQSQIDSHQSQQPTHHQLPQNPSQQSQMLYKRQQPKPTSHDLQQQQHYGSSMQDPHKKNKRPLGGPYLSQQRSFSSSEEELRSTPEFEGQS